jgi:hypothetical protein
MSGRATLCHSSFGFYVLSKAYIAIVLQKIENKLAIKQPIKAMLSMAFIGCFGFKSYDKIDLNVI